MDKEKYYNKIRDWVYNKFDKLSISDDSDDIITYLQFKTKNSPQVTIYHNTGTVHYVLDTFRNKIGKKFGIEDADLEIFLRKWIEDKFEMEVNEITSIWW